VDGYGLQFDSATLAYPDWPLALVPAALLLVAAVVRWRWPASRTPWALLAFAGIAFAFLVAMPYVDFCRVQAIARSGEGVHEVEGPISGHWTEVRRTRASGDIGWRTQVWEGFTVGGVEFGYWRGIAGSAVAFTNAGEPPLPLIDGLRVRIRWFADPWYDDERRILRLEVAGMLPR
jgi:hypothetical protein